MKTLRDILDHFDTVFWIVLVFGTSLASFMKKRAQQRAKEEAAGRRPTLMQAPPPPLERQPVAPLPVPKLPPPLPASHRRPVAPPESMGFRPGLLSRLEHPDHFKQHGNLRATGPAALSQVRAWRPSCSWREAVILHEVLGPARAFRESELPGLLL